MLEMCVSTMMLVHVVATVCSKSVLDDATDKQTLTDF
jgi:hypothetical protein